MTIRVRTILHAATALTACAAFPALAMAHDVPPTDDDGIVDLEARFKPVAAVEVAVGANNLFDQYPDRLPFGTVDGVNFGQNTSFLPYSSQSPFGFSGRFVYGRVSVDF